MQIYKEQKDLIYDNIFHWIKEEQANHKLVRGKLTRFVVWDGVKVKEITLNPSLFLMYCKVLILLNSDWAEKLLNDNAKYFHDSDIVEANVLIL